MKKLKTISFLLPGTGKYPVGGNKVVYEYANRLQKHGFCVNIIYSATPFYNPSKKEKIKTIMRYLYYLAKGFKSKSWFRLDDGVKEIFVPSLKSNFIPKSDCYFATSVHTAYYLNDLPEDKSSKYYLIQDFENWGVSDDYVYNSYSFGMNNIVISNWLKDKVESTNNTCSLIPNGFDFNYFQMYILPENKKNNRIAMLYHRDNRKGCKYGIEALLKIRNDFPDLEVTFFGVPDRPQLLPDWIVYYKTPDQTLHNQIYNEAAIYVAPSISEGWGLTVGEAMMCGCAVVCTDADGFKEMIEDEKNGLMCPTEDSDALYRNMKKLLSDSQLRIELGKNGYKSIKKFNWESSFEKLISLIKNDRD